MVKSTGNPRVINKKNWYPQQNSRANFLRKVYGAKFSLTGGWNFFCYKKVSLSLLFAHYNFLFIYYIF